MSYSLLNFRHMKPHSKFEKKMSVYPYYPKVPTSTTLEFEPKIEHALTETFLNSSLCFLFGGFFVDFIILLDIATIYLIPSVIDGYRMENIEEKLEE